MANNRQKKRIQRPAGKPRVSKSFARFVRSEKARIRQEVVDPEKQRAQIAALVSGLSYKKGEEVVGVPESTEGS